MVETQSWATGDCVVNLTDEQFDKFREEQAEALRHENELEANLHKIDVACQVLEFSEDEITIAAADAVLRKYLGDSLND